MIFLLFLIGMFSTPASAADRPGDTPYAESFTLANGLRVLVIPNHTVPAVAHMVWYRVGGSDEQQPKTGLAHYLEHLMFKATAHLQAGEFSRMVAYYGGNDNAFTTEDYTVYHQTIPREYLGLVMLLEADRMHNLQLDEATALKERDVILEERSMRVDNVPASLLSEQMDAMLYGLDYPYGVPVIGWRKDMEQLTWQDAQHFYHRYYAPNNATVIVSGDVTQEEVRELAEKYYGALPRNPELDNRTRAVQVAHITAPAPTSPIVLKDERVEQPEWLRYYLAPGAVSGETQHTLPLVVLAQLLGGGETGRLYQALVVKQQLATSAGADYDDLSLGQTIFRLYATPKPGVSFAQIQQAVEQEIALLLKDGATKQEMQRAKNLLRAQVIYARDGLTPMAHIYGAALSTGLDTDYVEHWPERITAVNPEQVLAAAHFIFDTPREVTGELVPTAPVAGHAPVPALPNSQGVVR